MIHRIKFEDLVELMQSENYQDRFVAEYIQTKQRHEKLRRFNTKIEAATRTQHLDNGVDEPLHVAKRREGIEWQSGGLSDPERDRTAVRSPAGLLREQQAAMGEYLHLLEVRAVIEDIDLEDAINYYIQKALKVEREYHGFTACECMTTEEIERDKACCQKDCAPPCEEGIYNPLVELPDDVMSLEDTISMLEAGLRCDEEGESGPCRKGNCPMWVKDSNGDEYCIWGERKSYASPLYHLKKYASSK